MQEDKQGPGKDPRRPLNEQTWDILTEFGPGAGKQHAEKAIVRNFPLFSPEDVAEARPLSKKFLPKDSSGKK